MKHEDAMTFKEGITVEKIWPSLRTSALAALLKKKGYPPTDLSMLLLHSGDYPENELYELMLFLSAHLG